MSNLQLPNLNEQSTEEIIQLVYQESFFRPDERTCYLKDGSIARWGLDLRIPFSQGKILSAVCSIYSSILEDMGITQVAGIGYAAAYIVAGLVASNSSITGGLIRKERKNHGFREIIEGKLQKDLPIAMVDDIISSGDTLSDATHILRSEGFNPEAAIIFFRFKWQPGVEKLEKLGIKVHAISNVRIDLQPEE